MTPGNTPSEAPGPRPGEGPDGPDTDNPLTPEDILDRVGAGEALDRLPADGKQATRLVTLARAQWRLVKGSDGRPYATAHDGPALVRPFRGRDGLRTKLANLYFETYRQAAGGAGLTDALAVLEGDAERDDPVPVALRVARDPTGRVVVDLGDAAARAVVIDPTGWQLIDRSPVLFRRSAALTAPLAAPTPGGTLDGLRDLVNVNEGRWRLIVGWLVASLIADVPHPILTLVGEQGTAKSTAARFIVELVDASTAPLRTAPSDMRDWAAGANGSWIVALDNISAIPPWLSDTLCKAVTGDGIVTRALFTDDDLSVLAFRRCIVVTTIDAGQLSGDLAERLLLVDLAPIGHRRSEAEVNAAYQATRGDALGALFDLTAKVLAQLPTIVLADAPRMADFARILAAVDHVCGWTTLVDYLGATAEANQAVLESSPVALAVMALVGRAGAWQGTTAELLDKLPSPDPRPRDWPRTARGLTGQLQRVAPALRAHGITIERPEPTGRNRDRILTIRANPDG